MASSVILQGMGRNGAADRVHDGAVEDGRAGGSDDGHFTESSIALDRERDHTRTQLLLLDRLLRIDPGGLDASFDLTKTKVRLEAGIVFVKPEGRGVSLWLHRVLELALVERGVEELKAPATRRGRLEREVSGNLLGLLSALAAGQPRIAVGVCWKSRKLLRGGNAFADRRLNHLATPPDRTQT